MVFSEFTTLAPALPRVLLFAIAFLWLSAALGRRLLIWLGLSRHPQRAERAVLAVAVGIGALQVVPLVLGAAGMLTPRTLLLALGATAAVLARDLWSVAARSVQAARQMRRPPDWMVCWIALMIPGLVAIGVLALLPTLDNDGLIYHLTVPKRWLESGSLSYLPTYPYSNTPMGAQTLFGIALVLVGDCGAKLVHFEAGLFAGAMGYLVGARLHGRIVGATASTLLFLLFALRHATLGSAYIEGMLVLEMGSALLASIIWLQEEHEGWLKCAMLLAGFSISFKITSAGFAVALLGLALVVLFERSSRAGLGHLRTASAVLLSAGPLAVLLALPVIPWLVRSALLTGNPFFPMLAGRVPTRDLTAESAARFAQAMRYRNWGANVDWSLARRELFVFSVGLGMTVTVLAASITFLRTVTARAAAIACLAASLLQLWTVGLNMRLWLPLLAIQMLLLVALAGRSLQVRWAPAALIAAAAAGSLLHIRKAKIESRASVAELVRSTVSEVTRRGLLLRGRPLVPIVEWANRHLPPDARVLLSNCQEGFYLDRSTLVLDFVQDALRLTTWEQFDADSRKLGITHVLTRSSLPPMDSLIDREHEFELVHRLVRERGHLLTRLMDAELYSLSPQATSAIATSPAR